MHKIFNRTTKSIATEIVFCLRHGADSGAFERRLPFRPDWQYEIDEITRVLESVAAYGQPVVVLPAESE